MSDYLSPELEAECRLICEEKGYDPDYPTGETRKQWETFTELARVRLAERAAQMISDAHRCPDCHGAGTYNYYDTILPCERCEGRGKSPAEQVSA